MGGEGVWRGEVNCCFRAFTLATCLRAESSDVSMEEEEVEVVVVVVDEVVVAVIEAISSVEGLPLKIPLLISYWLCGTDSVYSSQE